MDPAFLWISQRQEGIWGKCGKNVGKDKSFTLPKNLQIAMIKQERSVWNCTQIGEDVFVRQHVSFVMYYKRRTMK